MEVTYINESKKITFYDNDDIFIQINLNNSLKNKFKNICLPYIQSIIESMTEKELQIFKNGVERFFNEDNFNSIYSIINVTQLAATRYLKKYIEENNFKWKNASSNSHKVSFDEKEYFSVTVYSLVLKVMSIFLFNKDRDSYDYKKISKILINKLLPKTILKKIVEFVRFNIIKSAQSREHLWLFIELTIKLTPEIYIIDVVNFLIVHMFTFMKITNNIFGYIAGYVNQTNYYLYTDAYNRTEKDKDLVKLKYLHEFDLMEKHVVHITLEEVIYPLSKSMFEIRVSGKRKYVNSNSAIFKKYKIKPFTLDIKTKFPNHITKYITIPILVKLLDSKHFYFINFSKLKYLEFYLSEYLDNILNLKYIAKLIRSFPVGKISEKKYKSLKLMKRYIESFRDIENNDRKNMMTNRLYLTNIVNDIKSFLYYDPVYNDLFYINMDMFSQELISLFEMYFNGDLDMNFNKLRKDKFIFNHN